MGLDGFSILELGVQILARHLDGSSVHDNFLYYQRIGFLVPDLDSQEPHHQGNDSHTGTVYQVRSGRDRRN